MGKIVFFATSDSLFKIMNQFVATLPDPGSVHILTAELDNAVYIARGLNPQEVDALVVRGNTATILSEAHLPFPVIPILVGTQEIAEAFQAAKKLCKKEKPLVGVSGFEQSISNIKALLDLSGVEILFYHIGSNADVEKCVTAAINDHVDVLISGKVCTRHSLARGLPAVEMQGSMSSIRQAYNQALEFQKSAMQQKALSEEELVLARHAPEALIALDNSGMLLSGNNKAGEFLGIPANRIKGTRLTQFPPLEDLGVEGMLTLSEQNSTRIVRLGGRDLALAAEQAELSVGRTGFVLTITPVSDIQRRERAVRHALRSQPIHDPKNLEDIRGAGLFTQPILDMAHSCAHSSRPVLITGEQGCGGKQLAQSIHFSSPRKKNDFISFDCSRLFHLSLSESETQLFDLFRRAHTGTLYLKNLPSVPHHLQEQLLDILLEGVIPSKNNSPALPVDTRVIASAEGQHFHEQLISQLYYLFSPYTLPLTPLREHPEDIDKICRFFLSQIDSSFDPEDSFMQEMRKYRWPGNLMQLYAFVCRMNEQSQHSRISLNLLKTMLRQCGAEEDVVSSHDPDEPYTVVRNRVITAGKLTQVLEKHNGSKTQAALDLGISRTTLWKCMRELGLDK